MLTRGGFAHVENCLGGRIIAILTEEPLAKDSTTPDERRLSYPAEWEPEHRKNGLVIQWKETYPDLFSVMLANPAHRITP